jgi:DNA-binding transcriptional LysR family regulator
VDLARRRAAGGGGGGGPRLGIAWIAEYVAAADVRAGRLRQVLRDWCSAQTPIHAVYPTARHLSPKVVAFVELLRERFAQRGR